MGTIQFNLFFTNPHEYFINLFHNPYVHGYSRVFEDSHSFWNNLRTSLIAKMISLFDFLSFKNFWINSLFFNFLMFFGAIALYKVFISVFPRATIQLILCIFLLPSALFFSTMIHRDGLILLSLSMIIYHFYFFKKDKSSLKKIIIISLFLLLIFLLRNFVFLALVPPLIAWWISSKIPQKAFLIFTIIYSVSILLFFVSGFISPKIDFPSYVAQRQEIFIEIGKKANSTVDVKPLIPTVGGFISNAPQAFNLAFLRPYISTITDMRFIPFALEILLMEILFLLSLFFRKKSRLIPPIIYFSLFFSFSMLMIAG
ncbi:MAG: hypothetical protein ABI136_03085, partial [Ginsengibacter sp.]